MLCIPKEEKLVHVLWDDVPVHSVVRSLCDDVMRSLIVVFSQEVEHSRSSLKGLFIGSVDRRSWTFVEQIGWGACKGKLSLF